MLKTKIKTWTYNQKPTFWLKIVPWPTGVDHEVTKVGDMIISIIDHHKKPEHKERLLTQDNLVSRLKIIVTHLTKWLTEKWEWIISNDDLQVFIAYFTWGKNNYESIVDVIRWKNQMQFDEKLVKHIAKIIMWGTLPSNASLKISRNNKIQEVPLRWLDDNHRRWVNNSLEDFEKLGHDLYEMSLIIEQLHLSLEEKEKLVVKLNTTIKTYMNLLDN